MYREPVDSTAIKSIGYDPESKTLELEFQSGGVYRYRDVPSEVYVRLATSSSPGKFFHKNIKEEYDSELIEKGASQGKKKTKKKSGCFIATAAYGTPLAKDLDVLRDFRDEKLLTNNLGKSLTSIYYKTSPPIAGIISRSNNLRKIIRTILSPIIKKPKKPQHPKN